MLFGKSRNTNRYLIVLYNILALHLFFPFTVHRKHLGKESATDKVCHKEYIDEQLRQTFFVL